MPAKNTFFYPKRTLNCRGRILDLSQPLVMGILNITPDSFFDGGRYENEQQARLHCGKMLKAGADIIDVGAMSSKPGSEIISAEDEIQRLKGILPGLIHEFPKAVFSIDTVHSKTAQYCLQQGVQIVNDISAASIDPKILEVAGREDAPYVMMHMQGRPKTMQQHPTYKSVVLEVNDFLIEKIEAARANGIKDIIVDPGFGFGKSLQHNYQLLQQLDFFLHLDFPILAGVSRKSMINKLLGIKAAEALNGTSVLNTIALMKGASILRVHDVKEAVECVKIFSAFKNPETL